MKQIEIIKGVREKILELVSGLSVEQMNEIPEGFNNNIAWNIGHPVATQQSVCYSRAGLPMLIDEAFFERYKSGTKPEAFISAAEIEEIKQLFTALPDRLAADCDKQVFGNYTTWANRYGTEIGNIEDALSFVAFHEGIHFGYIMALKRALKK